MKKTIALVLALCTLFSLSGCGGFPIKITVTTSSPAETAEPTPSPAPTAPPSASKPKAKKSSASIAGIRPEFKEFLDTYEAFIDEYVAFMNSYTHNPLDTSLLLKYADFLDRYTDMNDMLDEIDEDELSDEELAYYIDFTARISKKMLDIEW